MPKITLEQEELEQANIPKKYWPFGAKTFKGSSAALTKLNDYIKKQQESNVFIVGPSRSGKTFFLSFALKCLLSQGYTCLYTRMDDVVDAYFKVTKPDAPGFNAQFGLVEYLALDNVDTASRAGASRTVMTRLLKLRSDEGLPTLLASSLLDETELENQYGPELLTFVHESLQIHLEPQIKTQKVFKFMSDQSKLSAWDKI